MTNGISDELAALHKRRLEAEEEIRKLLFGWMMGHVIDATLGEFRSLANEICATSSRAITDAFNIPRVSDHQCEPKHKD